MFGFKGKSENDSKRLNSSSTSVSAEYVDYEIIYSTTDFGLIAIMKSIFDEEGVMYFFQGENAAYLRAGIPVNLMIKKDQVDKAQEILLEILK